MPNLSISKKLFGYFPLAEILVRRIYWKNPGLFQRKTQKGKKQHNKLFSTVRMDDVFAVWKKWGIKEGDTVLVTSSYENLQQLHSEPEEILQAIINFLGSEGTLIMPAFPYYKNAPKKNTFLSADLSDELFYYNPKRNFVTTGILPGTLCKMSGAVRSTFPINTLVAKGKLADVLFEDEWKDDDPLPCGKYSGWMKCVENNAKIVSLGTDLTHSLTLIHAVEDSDTAGWPIKDWYRHKRFIIETEGNKREVTLKERHPKWGTMHFAERNLCKRLYKAGLMKYEAVGDINMEYIDSASLMKFLLLRKHTGYPYLFVPQSFLKK